MARISTENDGSLVLWVKPPVGRETAIAQATPDIGAGTYAQASKLICTKIERMRWESSDFTKSKVIYKEDGKEKSTWAVETPEEINTALKEQAHLAPVPVLQQGRWDALMANISRFWMPSRHL